MTGPEYWRPRAVLSLDYYESILTGSAHCIHLEGTGRHKVSCFLQPKLNPIFHSANKNSAPYSSRLRAWSRRVRAEARGGSWGGILGWHHRAVSAYTWCVTGKGPQRKWLHKIKKSDTPVCHCHKEYQEHPQEQSGEHLVEGCQLLAEARRPVERDELRVWGSRHAHKKGKGPVEPEKEKDKEEDSLELFFSNIYEFLNPVPAVNAAAFVPANLPPHYVINFVPAVSPVIASPAFVSSPVAPVIVSPPVFVPVSPVVFSSPDFSVVSSVNFVPASAFASTCIEYVL